MPSRFDSVLAAYLAHEAKLKGFGPRVILGAEKEKQFVLQYLNRKKLPPSTAEEVEWVVADFGGADHARELPGLTKHFWDTLGEPLYMTYLIDAKGLRVSAAQRDWLTAYNYAIALHDGDPSSIPKHVHEILGDYPVR